VADDFVPLPNLIPTPWKCSVILLASGPVTSPIRSGLGLELPLPDLPQVSDVSLLCSFLVVDPMTVERVKYNWEDPLNLESQLTEEEIAIR
jgi:hypothetical protein